MNPKPERHTFKKDRLHVKVFPNRQALGEAAAAEVAERMRNLLRDKERVRMIFAAAPSQNEFLQSLVQAKDMDWSRVDAFHMDDYIGLPEYAPQRFSRFLQERLFDKVKPGGVHLIDSSNGIGDECARYGRLLAAAPIDIVCLGIGENGHLAFNDPPVADFQDADIMKAVRLDEACRRQQVHDGCFADIDFVPTHALTLTIPTLMSGRHLYGMVPGPTKRKAVTATLGGAITTDCPSSILRIHPDCALYVDTESYGEDDHNV
ncbi:glucosamine-6-phosphate deaminase [Paenibacillus methanolicus]|uniref:Glucosamine-6-phosphate deaminase n=1 Tax=Paenibacillus methanolicus TaxID=582686 RepID=A0A5S5CLX3_9BACL|nr:glucosamine-6-phosphate deaminase [Paenibacillus methanolicus]TYP79398.1 glucosamine-6-phosphate deaminase [Paenibacillus methanolicus]